MTTDFQDDCIHSENTNADWLNVDSLRRCVFLLTGDRQGDPTLDAFVNMENMYPANHTVLTRLLENDVTGCIKLILRNFDTSKVCQL
jgi:hypothetical protein